MWCSNKKITSTTFPRLLYSQIFCFNPSNHFRDEIFIKIYFSTKRKQQYLFSRITFVVSMVDGGLQVHISNATRADENQEKMVEKDGKKVRDGRDLTSQRSWKLCEDVYTHRFPSGIANICHRHLRTVDFQGCSTRNFIHGIYPVPTCCTRALCARTFYPPWKRRNSQVHAI